MLTTMRYIANSELFDNLPEFCLLGESSEIEYLWSHFKGLLLKSVTEHIPKRLVKLRKKVSKPYISGEILRLVRRRQRVYSALQKRNCDRLRDKLLSTNTLKTR